MTTCKESEAITRKLQASGVKLSKVNKCLKGRLWLQVAMNLEKG